MLARRPEAGVWQNGRYHRRAAPTQATERTGRIIHAPPTNPHTGRARAAAGAREKSMPFCGIRGCLPGPPEPLGQTEVDFEAAERPEEWPEGDQALVNAL